MLAMPPLLSVVLFDYELIRLVAVSSSNLGPDIRVGSLSNWKKCICSESSESTFWPKDRPQSVIGRGKFDSLLFSRDDRCSDKITNDDDDGDVAISRRQHWLQIEAERERGERFLWICARLISSLDVSEWQKTSHEGDLTCSLLTRALFSVVFVLNFHRTLTSRLDFVGELVLFDDDID